MRAKHQWAPPLLLALALTLLTASWLVANPPGAAPDETANYVKALGAGAGELAGGAPRAANPAALVRRDAARAIRQGQDFLEAVGDSLSRAQESSRERLQAVLAHIHERCAPIPRSLTASSYYPRALQYPYQGRAATPLDRALLVTALAQHVRQHEDLDEIRGCRNTIFGLGYFLWQIGPSTNFIVSFLFGVAGTAFFALYGTDLPNHKQQSI